MSNPEQRFDHLSFSPCGLDFCVRIGRKVPVCHQWSKMGTPKLLFAHSSVSTSQRSPAKNRDRNLQRHKINLLIVWWKTCLMWNPVPYNGTSNFLQCWSTLLYQLMNRWWSMFTCTRRLTAWCFYHQQLASLAYSTWNQVVPCMLTL